MMVLLALLLRRGQLIPVPPPEKALAFLEGDKIRAADLYRRAIVLARAHAPAEVARWEGNLAAIEGDARHLFVREHRWGQAYGDFALPLGSAPILRGGTAVTTRDLRIGQQIRVVRSLPTESIYVRADISDQAQGQALPLIGSGQGGFLVDLALGDQPEQALVKGLHPVKLAVVHRIGYRASFLFAFFDILARP